MPANPRYANYQARVKAMRRVHAEETNCGICGQPVDKTLNLIIGRHGKKCQSPDCPGCTPHPYRGEVDEIIPISKGGSPTNRDNLRLAHRRCNRERSNGDKTKRPPIVPVVSNWDW